MITKTYVRKDDMVGKPADPTKGNPSFSSGIVTALPGRTWRLNAIGPQIRLYIDGDALTQQEETDLAAAYTAWVPSCQCRYEDTYRVETISNGRTTKVEWFATDNGDGTYTNISRDEVWAWSGATLVSITRRNYYSDGTTGSEETENYYTTGTGQRVTKRSQS